MITLPGPVLTADGLCDWLTSQGADWTLLPGPYVPDEPDRLTVVTMLPGPGLSTEQAMDTVGFQLRTRGGQRDYNDAQDMANGLDYVILAALSPLVGGVQVKYMDRTGGAPAPLGEPDNGDRQTFTATYHAVVASLIG